MGIGDKVKAAAEQVSGQVKEVVGTVTNDDKLVTEGKADQVSGAVNEKVNDVTESFEA